MAKEVRSIEERIEVFKQIVLLLKDLDPDIQERTLEAVTIFLRLGRTK